MAVGALLFNACTPEEIELGKVDVQPSDLVEGIAFKIEHDGENPNIVYLKSLMGTRYTPLWSHPQGRSQEHVVTLRMPFPGEYKVVYGVMTRGGIVYGDTATFEIADLYPDFISDPLWALLTGGVDEEKTWVLDLDADGVSKFFAGPLYFYGTDNGWEGDCLEEGGDCWNWNPDWKGNQWLMAAGDYGTMTFDLKGGAHIKADHKMLGRVETGTFLMDTDNKTMRINDAGPLHDSNRDGHVVDWGNLRIFSLTDSTLQLAALRDEALSGEGPCLLVYNYISKEYADNWTPGDQPEPEPALPDGWRDDVSKTVNTTIIWKLSENNPIDWATLDGSLMNGWQKPEDYPDWLGVPDPSVYGGFSMTMNSDDQTVVFVTPGGTSASGKYTLDEKGIYSFDVDVPSFTVINWASFAADANNQLRILRIEKDAMNIVTGMWLGARSSEKDEYMAYHLVPSGDGSTADPLAAWKKAFVGKTFKPDVNWFVDWVNFPPDFTGGWTSPETFGDDYTTNNWVWTEEVRAVAESASLTFTLEGDDIKLTLTQTKDGAPYTATGDVEIDPDRKILNISIPLVDYVGTVAEWLPVTNAKTITSDANDFYFVSHGGSSLSNIDTNGFWLGVVSNSIAAGDTKDEILIYHFVKQ